MGVLFGDKEINLINMYVYLFQKGGLNENKILRGHPPFSGFLLLYFHLSFFKELSKVHPQKSRTLVSKKIERRGMQSNRRLREEVRDVSESHHTSKPTKIREKIKKQSKRYHLERSP